MIVHIKRCRFNDYSREKLSTDVHFPVTGLDLRSSLNLEVRPKSLNNNNNNSSEKEHHIYTHLSQLNNNNNNNKNSNNNNNNKSTTI
jgi:hypothetical protein